MKQGLTALIIFFTFFFGNAQNNSIGANEKLVFTASYNMSGLMTDLAQLTMETSEVSAGSGTLLRLKCRAQTFKKWDNFFKINDLYESYVNKNSLNPYLHKREINEGGYYKFKQYKYNRKAGTAEALLKKKVKGEQDKYWSKKENLKLSNNTFDIVATIYKIRNLDIYKASVGDSDTFKVLFDNQVTPVRITLLGKESLNTEIGMKECYKLGISIVGSDVLKGNNSNLLWLTADANKIPVYAKFKVAVGNGELRIRSASGLKN